MSKDRSKVLQGSGSFSLFVIAQPPFSYEGIGFQGNREGAEKDCSLHSQPHSSPSSFLLLSVLSKRGFLSSGFPVDVSGMFRLVFSFFFFFYFSKIRFFTAKKIIYTITCCGSIGYTLQWRFFRIAATAKSLQNYSLLIGMSLIISRVLF